MSASRVSDIISSLEFAMDSNRELAFLISEAQKTDTNVKHISHKTGAILQSVRKCYDYCISDIRDDFLNSKNNVYFPFSKEILLKKPLKDLKNKHRRIHSKLFSIAKNIELKNKIPNTLCLYSDAKVVNKLVNNDKHNSIIEISELKKSKTRIESPDGTIVTCSPIYPVGSNGIPDFSNPGLVGSEAWSAPEKTKVTAVKDFIFTEDYGMSRKDVHGFCMIAITSTRFILGEVYNIAYDKNEDIFYE